MSCPICGEPCTKCPHTMEEIEQASRAAVRLNDENESLQQMMQIRIDELEAELLSYKQIPKAGELVIEGLLTEIRRCREEKREMRVLREEAERHQERILQFRAEEERLWGIIERQGQSIRELMKEKKDATKKV